MFEILEHRILKKSYAHSCLILSKMKNNPIDVCIWYFLAYFLLLMMSICPLSGRSGCALHKVVLLFNSLPISVVCL